MSRGGWEDLVFRGILERNLSTERLLPDGNTEFVRHNGPRGKLLAQL